MQIGNTKRQWGVVQQGLHWIVVLAVVAQLVVGFVFAGLDPESATWRTLFPVHTTLGVSIWTMHAAGALLLLALMVLHVTGALRHAWLLKDGVLRRMTSFGRS